MGILCKQCHKDILKKNPDDYNYVEFKWKHIKYLPDNPNKELEEWLDEGKFCSPTCLYDYLAWEPEAE